MARINTLRRGIRRYLNRSHWLTRLFRLPVSEGPSSRPGVVLIQVDGLSEPQFRQALKKGEMPFLRRLLKREQYRLHSQYSGLPAATPAAQAELFYGVKTAVPAFSFRDRESGKIIRMYEPDAASRVESRLRQSGNAALLAGGSAYADNFTGGAAEAHFCPASLGWGPALRTANPLALLVFLISNFYSFLRIGVLLGVELLLALVDFMRGISHGHDFIKELKFIPARVAISILLRELCVIGGKIDINRGLPIIHINFLGYDEQAHRRGPDSLFAHWTLKGIDDAIARLWRATRHAPRRRYQVWVYSDHGQHAALPYKYLQEGGIETAVAEVFSRLQSVSTRSRATSPNGIQTQRVRLLGGHRFQRLFAVAGLAAEPEGEETAQVAALGPVGQVYAPDKLDIDQRRQVARDLARRHQVPVTLIAEDSQRIHAWTATAEFMLPGQAAELFGADHPFLGELEQDLISLCRHPDAGDVILLGWHQGATPITFATEGGSHAGATPNETHCFSLLPRDAPLPARSRDYLRLDDLRTAVLQRLGQTQHSHRSCR
jgi:hypothetical protein